MRRPDAFLVFLVSCSCPVESAKEPCPADAYVMCEDWLGIALDPAACFIGDNPAPACVCPDSSIARAGATPPCPVVKE